MSSTQTLSARSLERYRSLVKAVCAQLGISANTAVVGLIDRKHDDRLALLDLDTGGFSTSAPAQVDIVIVEQPSGRRAVAPNFQALKSCLSARGAIVLRRRSIWARLVGRWFSRRKDDTAPAMYGRGMDRRETALRQAGLYLTVLDFKFTKARRENWLMASTSARDDRRFRDQIGRVTSDYLRVVGPWALAAGF